MVTREFKNLKFCVILLMVIGLFSPLLAAQKVVEWSFDGNTSDTSGSGNDGTLYGGDPNYVDGIDGQCLEVTWGQYVEKLSAVNLPTTGSASWSLNIYLMPNATVGNWWAMGGFGSNAGAPTNRHITSHNSDSTIMCSANPNYLPSTYYYDVNKWQMVTATYDGVTLRLYKDGVEISSMAANFPADCAAEVRVAPDFWNNAVGHFTGLVDEFTIWDDALTATEIEQLTTLLPSLPEKVLEWSGDSVEQTPALNAEQAIATANITASANATLTVYEASLTIDGSGLNSLYLDTNNGLGQWVCSAGEAPSSAVPGVTAEGVAWLKYDFDQTYQLGEMWVWNANQYSADGGGMGRGLRWVTIEYYDGASWQVLGDYEFAEASGIDGAAHGTVVDFGGVTASSVVITPKNEDVNPADGFVDGRWNGSWGGYAFSEVRFGISNTSATLVEAGGVSAIYDTSGKGNDGAVTGSVNIVPGLLGNAIELPGGNNFIMNSLCSELPVGGIDTWSINMYVYANQQVTNWGTVGGFGDLNFGTDGLSRGLISYNDVNGNPTIRFAGQSGQQCPQNPPESSVGFDTWDTGMWQMITATFNGATIKLYKNGVLIQSRDASTFATPFADTIQSASLGFNTWGQRVNAKIDEFGIWNYAISEGEIAQMASILPATKVLHWDFDTIINEGREQFIDATNIAVDASGSRSVAVPAENTINSSGMTGLLHNDSGQAIWLHAAAEGEDHTVPLPDTSAVPGSTAVGPAWIAYQFDQAYTLGEMWVWNNNQGGGGTGRGMRWVTIQYTVDGSNWTTLGDFEFAQAPGTANYAHNTVVDFAGATVRAVVITAHGGTDGLWNTSWGYGYGLAEVRFGIKDTFVGTKSVADVSGNDNIGVIAGDPNAVDGKFGDAFTFEAGDSVNLSNGLNLPTGKSSPWTMNAWVKTAAQPQSNIAVFGLGNYFGQGQTTRYLTYEGGVSFWDHGLMPKANAPLDIAKWSMLTVVYDTTDLKLYKNGMELVSTALTFAGNATTDVQLCPVDPWDNGQEFVGEVDELTIWSGALKAEDISDMYLAGDFDDDRDVDQDDLKIIASEWTSSNIVGDYTESVINDFESYADTNALVYDWYDYYNAPGINVLTLIDDAGQANSGSKAMAWQYDNSAVAGTHSDIVYDLIPSIDLSAYDKISISIKRHAGNSTEDLLYIKILDSGTTDSNIAAEYWIDAAGGSTSDDADQWYNWEFSLNELMFTSWGGQANGYYSLDDITDMQALMIGCYSTGVGGTGTIDIDDIKLVTVPSCSATPLADVNGDCEVDIVDYSQLAKNWLKSE